MKKLLLTLGAVLSVNVVSVKADMNDIWTAVKNTTDTITFGDTRRYVGEAVTTSAANASKIYTEQVVPAAVRSYNVIAEAGSFTKDLAVMNNNGASAAFTFAGKHIEIVTLIAALGLARVYYNYYVLPGKTETLCRQLQDFINNPAAECVAIQRTLTNKDALLAKACGTPAYWTMKWTPGVEYFFYHSEVKVIEEFVAAVNSLALNTRDGGRIDRAQRAAFALKYLMTKRLYADHGIKELVRQ